MSVLKAIASGLVGAITVTLINETARKFIKDAPRLDVVGKRAFAYPLMRAGKEPPPNSELYWYSLGSDLAANSLYFSLVGLGGAANALPVGGLLGAAAGVGAVALTEPLGLGDEPVNRTRETEIMTVAWYLAGGLAAAATYQFLTNEE
ncbi:MAG TPA: hypothetical protein VGC76_09320 [Pyrinomonadaceae bacterium]|jgi:hypothetical protein